MKVFQPGHSKLGRNGPRDVRFTPKSGHCREIRCPHQVRFAPDRDQTADDIILRQRGARTGPTALAESVNRAHVGLTRVDNDKNVSLDLHR